MNSEIKFYTLQKLFSEYNYIIKKKKRNRETIITVNLMTVGV